jgi:hypothetical protein
MPDAGGKTGIFHLKAKKANDISLVPVSVGFSTEIGFKKS